MRKTGAFARHEGGSVLMECLLVLPLYFALFAGMFFMGELSLNYIRVHVGDHTATWLGASRFGSRDDSGIVSVLAEGVFKETMELVGGIRVDKEDDDGNHFLASYRGGLVALTVAMPYWARGMLSMQDTMQGGTAPVVSSTGLEQEREFTYFDGEANNWRSASVHRTADGAVSGEYNRMRAGSNGVKAGEMIQLQLMKVLMDSWPHEMGNSQVSSGGTQIQPVAAPQRALAGYSE